jgi:hypothetical protein
VRIYNSKDIGLLDTSFILACAFTVDFMMSQHFCHVRRWEAGLYPGGMHSLSPKRGAPTGEALYPPLGETVKQKVR